ncbi:hypothetical protein M409DRAFT_63127 [Zasmidium cellare ATCC 36951]|uniref:protein-tyrosine-phosphatase n=1 Tax=Zasmidium cellare ATCC 36951 TaxID=1080233 RepID=A0A6A6D0A8_ZASCE|nr:uncharacterized protein M409DRAFT_63127 [Zasmidium cellare ATCC 36951]KAF2172443.1 hypothetical protein M409DRAFT_63127 [Zasmidium cellare ATCC 36951]
MSQTDDEIKQLPQSATTTSQKTLQPAHDYEQVFRKFHQHTLSDSSNTLGSNESSPTTTISTVDDSSATEPSPGSSPESPPPSTFAVGMLRPRTADDSRSPYFELQKQPPPRKGRNLKNLAVNTSRHTARAASTTSLPIHGPSDDKSTILSPSFVKPPTPPRRKPSNLGLTILTPGGAKPPPQEVRLAIPPTPGFSRPGTLRHFQSSPSLPLVPGLGLPHSNQLIQQQRTLDTIFSPIEPKESPQEEEEDEQNFDIPLSKEEKPEAYPDGPICVYDPNIDLYLEPTAEQARQYDVIMNVASEVRNPFTAHHEPAPVEPDVRIDGGGGIQYAPKRTRLAIQTQDGKPSNIESSPTTPKATPLETTFPKPNLLAKDPEYIHIPWEHNSDIVPDLLRLVKLIDEKVIEGKRVLVHCQCGVSRSASLVVAYGLYKNPSMSVQEAYDAVKKRSKWIGPNMNLIMQLQEFRSSLARGGLLPGNRGLSPLTPSSALSEWNGPFSNKPSPLATREPLSAVEPPSASARSPADDAVVSPGPSSAPSGFVWPPNDKQRGLSLDPAKPTTAYVDPSGHVVPVLKVIEADKVPSRKPLAEEKRPSTSAETQLSSPRTAEFAMTPLQPSREADPADTFGLMSPTSTEFAANPFDRSALLASLGMGSMRADEETPRRSLSLRNRERPQPNGVDGQRLQPEGGRKLRPKLSSPTLREQQQLQSLQAKIEATLPVRNHHSAQLRPDDDAPLMSPRATEFTSNPFALSLSIPSNPPQDTTSGPPRTPDADPRSPAHKSQSPIVRNIFDVL